MGQAQVAGGCPSASSSHSQWGQISPGEGITVTFPCTCRALLGQVVAILVGGRPLAINTSSQCRHSEDSSLQSLRSWLATRLWAPRAGWGALTRRAVERTEDSPSPPWGPSTALPDPETQGSGRCLPTGLFRAAPGRPRAPVSGAFCCAHTLHSFQLTDRRLLLCCLFALYFSTEYPRWKQPRPLPNSFLPHISSGWDTFHGWGRKKM